MSRRSSRFVDAQSNGTLVGSKMASYFDEHNCEPTDPEEQYRQNALLELAR